MVWALTPEKRATRVISLRAEIADKLARSWRGKAATDLLKDGPAEAVPVEAIQEALQHIHISAENVYVKIARLRDQLSLVGLLLAFMLIVLLWFPSSILPPDGNATVLRIAVFAGLIGAMLSAAFSTTRTPLKAKIPDVRRTEMIILTRVVIGSAAAVPIFLLAESGLAGLQVQNDAGLAFYCFLAGFSERWFLRRLGDVAKGTTSSEKDET